MDKNKFYIASLLFELYNVKTLDKIIFNEKVANRLKVTNDLLERKAIYTALIWAKDNENFDFKSVLQNAPVTGHLSFSNSEIYGFLMKFKKFIEENNLLVE